MNRYILQPEDEIGVLPPGEEEAVIRVFCERTMVFFAVSQLESVTRQENVRTGSGPQTCLCLTGPDALLGERHEVFVPVSRGDYPAFERALRACAPAGLDFGAEAAFVPEACDHKGRRHPHEP